MILAIVKNNLDAIKFFNEKTKVNLFYNTAKPGTYDFSDTCTLKA